MTAAVDGVISPNEEPGGARRPPGASDATVAAVGKVSEALEWVERARGHLYEFHQLMGHADLTLSDAVTALMESGQSELANAIDGSIVGRNVLYGRWTFQIVEEFDDGYYAAVVGIEQRVRDELMDGRRHVFEYEMKERERTRGLEGHERGPDAEIA